MMEVEHFKEIIDELSNEFDSHEFIKKFMKRHEREYVEMLYKNINTPNGIFRAVDAEIARFLSVHAVELGIRKDERGSSGNPKMNKSENQSWTKNSKQ